MSNYHFRILVNDGEEIRFENAYVLAEDYNKSVDKLFKTKDFINYEFLGIVG